MGIFGNPYCSKRKESMERNEMNESLSIAWDGWHDTSTRTVALHV